METGLWRAWPEPVWGNLQVLGSGRGVQSQQGEPGSLAQSHASHATDPRAPLTYPNSGYLGFLECWVGRLSFLEGLRRLKEHNLGNIWLKCLKFQ